MVTELGAHAAPALLGGGGGGGGAGRRVAVVPLQSWHHCNFLSSGPVADMPGDHPLRHMDGGCRWPAAVARCSTSAGVARLFARCNEELLRQALGTEEGAVAAARGHSVVSFSHFLPRPELHRTHPSALADRLGDVEGSLLLGAQVLRLAPAAHVFGHTHFSIDVTLGATRFVQHPLGNPKERELPGSEFPLCISTSARAPLAEVWSAAAAADAAAADGSEAEGAARRRSDPSELSQFLAGLGAKWQPPGFKGLQGRAAAVASRNGDSDGQRGAGGSGEGNGGEGGGGEGGDGEGGGEGSGSGGETGGEIGSVTTTPRPEAPILVAPHAATSATWSGADELGAEVAAATPATLTAAAAPAPAAAAAAPASIAPAQTKKADQAKLAAFLAQKYGAGGSRAAADVVTSAGDSGGDDDDDMMECMSEKLAQKYGVGGSRLEADVVICTGGDSDDGMECMGEKTRAERDAELRSEAVDLEDL